MSIAALEARLAELRAKVAAAPDSSEAKELLAEIERLVQEYKKQVI